MIQSDKTEAQTLVWEEMKIPRMLNVTIVSLSLISILIGHYFVSMIALFHFIKQEPAILLAFLCITFVYIALHELIHGGCMNFYSGIKATYGISGPFIYAKSEAIFNRKAYLIITLAPMLILGLSAAVLSVLLPGIGLWFGIFVWVLNLYASRGDLQAVMVVKELPRTYAIQDDGHSLQIYHK
ncbi:DUF3267 domain-containing protein [Guptibacillus spartinae]|uniref:DUF3267 domain-containing protein n=1 Tax=Guptibacillus spartinae TaxID=3025679 RepID=UPI00235E15CF|nr:DUF3267 domain-containing protein [Pseudalkalibacillus spartinae]